MVNGGEAKHYFETSRKHVIIGKRRNKCLLNFIPGQDCVLQTCFARAAPGHVFPTC